MTFLFLKSFKNTRPLLPLKVRHRNLDFELIYLNVYLDSFYSCDYLIPIKTQAWHFCFEIIQ